MGAEAAEPGLDLALRRVLVGYRLVAAGWATLLGVAVLAEGRPPRALAAVAGTVALLWAWTGMTALLVARHPGVLRRWVWMGADLAVAAWSVLVPSLAGLGSATFAGGYPFSVVLIGVYARGLLGGLVTAGVLSAVTVARLPAEGVPALSEVVASVLVYVAGAVVAAWGLDVIRGNEAQRRAVEAALSEERAERIRSQERAETAAHLHDSVLQTLALVQRRSRDPAEVTALARRQERELRAWLAGERASPGSFAQALAATAEHVEARHHVTIEVVHVGDAPLDEHLEAVVAAATEALVNAACHAGVDRVSLYAEVTVDAVRVFVRDRGVGFDPEHVDADRRGVRESIVGRLARHGGTAVVASSPGEGTEVKLEMPRDVPSS